jgi:WD40 repeat protein
MNKIKIFSLIVVFTALFTGCEEPIDGTDTQNGGGNSGIEVDYTKFKCLQTLMGHSEGVHSVAYSPDGTRIISGSNDDNIKIWNANTGECIKTIEAHSGDVYSVAYSPDGTKIISGLRDETIKIWKANTGQCLKTLKGNT